MDENKDYKYYLNSGIEKTNKKDFKGALEELDKAIELNFEQLQNNSSAIAFHNLNQLQAAFENYSKAIELDEKMIDAYFNRAQAIMAFDNPKDEELKQALSDLEKAISLDPKFIDAHYFAATLKKKFEDYEGALQSLDKVLEIDPQAVYSKALKKLILQKYLKKD